MDLKSLESEQYDYEKEKPVTLSGKANLRAKEGYLQTRLFLPFYKQVPFF